MRALEDSLGSPPRISRQRQCPSSSPPKGEAVHAVARLMVTAVLALGVGLFLPSLAEPWCTKVTTLNGLNQRFPSNNGPDVVVRVDLGQSVQDAVDTATDSNGDGYIIVGAVNGGNGEPNGFTVQRVVVDRVYLLPFGLFGCSLTLLDPAPSDGLPTIHVTANAASPDLFAMDLHGAGSPVAGWLVEGSGRYIRNAYARGNAIGYWFIGDNNTLRNGSADDNTATGVLFEGNGNTITGHRIATNKGHGIQVIGDHNVIKQNGVGDRGIGNSGVGIHVSGVGNLLQENQIYSNGSHGIDISGGSAASPNIIRRNSVGDRGRGNQGHGIFVHDASGNGLANPLELEQNTTRANGLHGIVIAETATGHELKGNISGGTADLNNGDCEFLVAAGNINATGNRANGFTIPGRDGDPFPAACLGSP